MRRTKAAEMVDGGGGGGVKQVGASEQRQGEKHSGGLWKINMQRRG